MFRPEEFAQELIKDLKLPLEFEHLISMAIRKQIRDYALSSIQGFAEAYLKTKNHLFNTKPQSMNKNQFITTNTGRRNNFNGDSLGNKFKVLSTKTESKINTSMIKKYEQDKKKDFTYYFH